MSFANLTGLAALDVPYVGPDGREVVIVIVKGTYDIVDATCSPARRQRPVRTGDEVLDPVAHDSSIVLPSDVVVEKRGADLIVNGEAIAPKRVVAMDVAVSFRDRVVPMRVHGERVFYKGAGGALRIGDAAPFERKRLVYERAYGGTSSDYTRIEHRNPVGRGVANSDEELVGTPAPQMEHPAQPVGDVGIDHPAPVGFGAIGTHWEPRRSYAGTFDEAWKRNRMPLMPENYDLRHNNCAHPSLQFDAPLVGGEEVRVLGMSEEGVLQATLPTLSLKAAANYDDGTTDERRLSVDTLLIEPDRARLELTARTVVALGRGARCLRELRVEQHG